MKKKLSSVGIVITIFLMLHSIVFAAESKTIEVGFNQINVKVNGNPVNSNNILYEGTTYIPIRDVASMLGLAANFYDVNKTAYIGHLPAGELPDDVVESWDIINPATSRNDIVIEPRRYEKINVVLNDVVIKVHGEKINSDNILYNGTTYAPIRAVAEFLNLDVTFDNNTSTAYIGTAPDNSVKQSNSKMYHVPAEGEMQGWQLLKGHEYEDVAEIYYSINGSIVQTQLKDIRDVDLNQIVEWIDDDGNKMYITLGDLYYMFGTFSQYTNDWFLEKFGDIYIDWIWVSAIKAEKIVDEYLISTGQLKTQSKVTLTPDTAVMRVDEPAEELSIEEIIKRINENNEKENPKSDFEKQWISSKQLDIQYNIYFALYNFEKNERSFRDSISGKTLLIVTLPNVMQENEELTSQGIKFKKLNDDIYINLEDLRDKGIIE